MEDEIPIFLRVKYNDLQHIGILMKVTRVYSYQLHKVNRIKLTNDKSPPIQFETNKESLDLCTPSHFYEGVF